MVTVFHNDIVQYNKQHHGKVLLRSTEDGRFHRDILKTALENTRNRFIGSFVAYVDAIYNVGQRSDSEVPTKIFKKDLVSFSGL